MAIEKRISLTVDAKGAKDVVERLRREFDNLSISVKKSYAETTKASGSISKYKSYVNASITSTIKLTSVINSLSIAYSKLDKSINLDKTEKSIQRTKAAESAMLAYRNGTLLAAKANKDYAESFKAIPKSAPSAPRSPAQRTSPSGGPSTVGRGTLLDYAGAISNSERVAKQAIGTYDKADAALLKYDTSLRKLNKSLAQGKISQADYSSALTKIEDTYDRIASKTSGGLTPIAPKKTAARDTLLEYTGAISNSDRITKQSIGTFNQADRALLKYDTTLRRLNKSLAQGQIGQSEYNKALSKAESSYNRLSLRSNKLSSSTSELTGALGGLFALISGQQIIQAADAYTEFTNKIRLTIQAGESLAATQQKLTDLAVETRTNLNDNSTLYLRLANSLDRNVFSQERLLNLQRTINQSIAIGGSTAVEANAALLQFSQAAGSDFKAVGQELNSINEQAFGLSDAIIKGLKETDEQFNEFEKSRGIQGRAALKKYAEEGLLSTQKVLIAIESQANRVNKDFSSTEVTVSKALTNLNTRFTEFVGKINQSSGATNSLVTSINLVSENFDILASGLLAVGGAYIAARIPAMLAAFTAFAVANPIGLIATALAAVIIYFKLNSEQTKKAAAELDKVTKAAEAFAKSQEGLTDQQKKARIETIQQNIQLLRQNTVLNDLIATRSRLFALQKQLEGTSAEPAIAANIAKINAEIAKAGDNTEETKRLNEELDKLTGRKKDAKKDADTPSNFGQTSALAELELLAKYNKESAIELEYLKAIQEIEKAEGVSRITKQEALLQAQNAYNSALIENRLQQKELAKESEESSNKIADALNNYTKSAYDFQSSFADVVGGTFKGLEDSLVGFVRTSRFSVKDLADSILSDLLRIQIRAAVLAPLSSSFASLFGGSTTQGASTANGISSVQTSRSAKGNAFVTERFAKGGLPSLSSMSGSVVKTPTHFATGVGLMGERGAEAILPLQRTASGDLGVASTGSGGDISVNIQVINEAGQPVQAVETGRRRNGNQVDIQLALRQQINNAIASGAADSGIKSRFGFSPIGA